MRAVVKIWIPLLVLSLTQSACSKKKAPEQAIQAVSGPVRPPASTEVPDGVIAWAVAGNLQELIKRAETLAAKAGPVPTGMLGAGIAASLSKAGLKDTSAIELSKPLGLLVLDPQKHKNPLVMALSTKGEKAVLESMKPVWKRKGSQDGILEMSREMLDTYAVFKGGKDATGKKVEQLIYIQFDGLTALLANERDALVAGATVLLERLKAGAPASGVQAAVHVDHLRKAFQSQLAVMPTIIKQQIESAVKAGQQPGALDDESIAWMTGLFIDKLVAFVQQTKQVGLALGVEPDGALFHLSLAPEKDSFFEKLVAAQKPAELKLADSLQPDTVFAFACNAQWGIVKQDMLDFSKQVIERLVGQQLPSEIEALFAGLMDVLGDEMALSIDMDPRGALRFYEQVQVLDEAKAKEMVSKSMKLYAEMVDKNDQGFMGVRTTIEGPKALGEHKGVELQQVRMKIDMSGLPTAQAKMVTQMYGGAEIPEVFAVFDRRFAIAMGQDAEQEMKAAIDRFRDKTGGLTSSAVFRHAAGDLMKGAGGFAFLSISQIASRSIQNAMAITGGQATKLALPAPKSGLFLRVKSEKGSLVSTLRLPAAHLEEIGAVFQAVSKMSSD